jgi:hypothetical protein
MRRERINQGERAMMICSSILSILRRERAERAAVATSHRPVLLDNAQLDQVGAAGSKPGMVGDGIIAPLHTS